MKSRDVCVLCVLVATAGVWTEARAQGWQRSMIVGTAIDESGASLRGAEITLSGATLLGGPRTTLTDDTGRYRFVELVPGTYDLVGQAKGFTPIGRPGIFLPVETTYIVDLRFVVSPRAEQVDVSALAPLIDATRSGYTPNYSAALLQALPTARTLTAALNLAPGVTENVAFGGTQSTSNGFSIDGVGLNNAYLGEQWVRPHFNWLSEVQVVAIAAPAEYGGFTGAIANSVLRSGANRYSGLFDYTIIRPSWTADNTGGLPAGSPRPTPRTILHWRDAALQVGGPVIRDRVSAFAGVSYVDHDYRNFGYTGDASTNETIPRWMVKADAVPGRSVQLQGFYLRDTSDIVGAELSRTRLTPETSADVHQRKHAWNGRVSTAPSANTLFELRIGGHAGESSRDPHAPASRTGPPTMIDAVTNLSSGNTPLYASTISSNVTGTAALTRYLQSRVGGHELKVGVSVEQSRATQESGFTAGAVYYHVGGVPVYADLWGGDRIHTRNNRTTAYVQDRWAWRRFTIESGIRLDWYRGSVPGNSDVFSTGAIGPRLGMAWDINGNHRTVVRMHYGRYHDMPFGYLYAFADRAERNPVIGVEFAASGVPQEISRRFEFDLTTSIDPSLRQSHMDQVSAGVERQLGAHWAVQAQYVRRWYGNFIGYVDPRLSEAQSFSALDSGPDGLLGTPDDGGQLVGYVPAAGDRNLILSNPSVAWRRYDGVQIIARKRLSRSWQMEASLTASRSYGTVGNETLTNLTGFSLSPGGIGADPEWHARGSSRSQFDYSEAKLIGTYEAPWLGGFRVGSVLRWRDGSRWYRRVLIRSPVFTICQPSSRTPGDCQASQTSTCESKNWSYSRTCQGKLVSTSTSSTSPTWGELWG